MFLTEYPNGDVRKGRHQVDGYKAHTRRNTKKTKQEIVSLSSDDESGADDVEVMPVEASPVEISLSDISSNDSEWSSSDSEQD